MPMDIQEQHHHLHHHHHHHHHHQQRPARTMLKAGARRLSSGPPGSCDSLGGAGKTSWRDRDDCCYLRSPPSSPRPYPSSTASITPPSSTSASPPASPPPPPATSTSTTVPAPPAPRNGRPAHKLSLSIPRRLLRSDWVSLEGLVSCALSCLRKDECTGISELGGFFFFYFLEFFLLSIFSLFNSNLSQFLLQSAHCHGCTLIVS